MSCATYQEKNEELCKGLPSKEIILVEEQQDFNTANYLCQAFGGQLPIPKNEFDVSELTNLLQKSNFCFRAYVGLKKSKHGIQDLNGNNISYAKWSYGQPNGKELQKCIVIEESSLYNDWECGHKNCYACQIPTKNMYTMRGSLISSDIDKFYFVGMSDKYIEIRGFKESVCTYNESWKFGSITLMNQSNPFQPPVGLKLWNNSQNLKFTQCKIDEFTCHAYGNCISIYKRCDGHPDCPFDGTDEIGCKFMAYKEGYNKKYPPGKYFNEVSMQVYIENIYDIHELESYFKVQLKVYLSWFDERITFKNLKKDATQNLLDTADIKNVWLPEIVFGNSNDKQRIKAGQGDDWSIAVVRQGLPKLNPVYEIDEDYLYPGKENVFWLSVATQVKLHCDFDLAMYPFDIQSCPIVIEVPYEYFNQFKLHLVAEPNVTIPKLIQYDYLDIEHSNSWKGIRKMNITIKLKRIPTYHLTSTYIPTLCLIIIAELTLFIDVIHFEATIMVALTAMLVMYTLYQSLSDNLPQTAYLKMIDVWLFAGLMLPFIIICILIALNALVLYENKQVISLRSGKKNHCKSKYFMKTMQIVIPVLTTILGLSYMFVALYDYFK